MDKLYEILEKSGASDFLIRETTTCSLISPMTRCIFSAPK